MTKPLVTFTAILIAVSMCGCDPDWPGTSTQVIVSGTVTLDGQPLDGARVIFIPIMPLDESLGELRPMSFGTTDALGKYQLRQADGTAGAITGQHTILISKPGTAIGLAASKDIKATQKDSTQLIRQRSESLTQSADLVPDFYRRHGYLKRHVMPLPSSEQIDLKLSTIDPLLLD